MNKKYTFGTVRSFDRAKAEETRTLEFLISTAAKDRHNSILNMKGWQLDNFNANPIVGYQHDVYGANMCTPANPDNVLGPGRAFLEGENLIGEVTFETKDINPLAEKIFRKVLNGTLRATSVGFLEVGKGEERKVEGQDIYFFEGQELLEFSIVNIPSNPEAVGRAISNHMDSALAYLMQFMPEEMSVKDLRNMKVQTVLDYVAGRVEQKAVEEVIQGKSKSLFERKLKVIESQINNY